jgi:fructosamine-3-kinase
MQWTAQLQSYLSHTLGKNIAIGGYQPVSGGCIHSTARISSNHGDWFLKHNDASHADAFAAEAEGLNAIAATNTIRVPQVVAHGSIANKAFLLLEFIVFAAPNAGASARMGEQLAHLHLQQHTRYGWSQDSFLGPTPQPNPHSDDWIAFFRDQRLGHLQDLLAANGCHFPHLDALKAHLPAFFDDAELRPSLLHGDLWGGNAAFASNGDPVIFDPACYIGHAEADLAMTRLFGGFDKAFYTAYHAVSPIPKGFQRRCQLYNLYHLLNHALIFGGSYAAQCHSTIDGLLRGRIPS